MLRCRGCFRGYGAVALWCPRAFDALRLPRCWALVADAGVAAAAFSGIAFWHVMLLLPRLLMALGAASAVAL